MISRKSDNVKLYVTYCGLTLSEGKVVTCDNIDSIINCDSNSSDSHKSDSDSSDIGKNYIEAL